MRRKFEKLKRKENNYAIMWEMGALGGVRWEKGGGRWERVRPLKACGENVVRKVRLM